MVKKEVFEWIISGQTSNSISELSVGSEDKKRIVLKTNQSINPLCPNNRIWIEL
jgi:hypothetical protein